MSSASLSQHDTPPSGCSLTSNCQQLSCSGQRDGAALAFLMLALAARSHPLLCTSGADSPHRPLEVYPLFYWIIKLTQVLGVTTDHQSKDELSCVAEPSGEEGRRGGTSLLWRKELLNWLILLSNFTRDTQNVHPECNTFSTPQDGL